MIEIWAPVTGFETHYEVSTHGRVRRISYTNRGDREFVGAATSHGYRAASFTIGRGSVHRYIHRLVACAFIANPRRCPYVNHIDGNKTNNTVQNLEWTTPRENLLHRSRVLGKVIGTTHHGAKLNPDKVQSIRKLFTRGFTNREIAHLFGVSTGAIRGVRSQRTWFHVPPAR